MMDLPFVITGKVIHGNSLGNSYDSPTANITPEEDISDMPRGVYYSVTTIDGKDHPSITNLGIRPTVSNDGGVNAETYIYDYNDDLYDRTVAVKLLGFRRAEQRFGSVDELFATVKEDMAAGARFHEIAYNG